jgi:hypothetical protein
LDVKKKKKKKKKKNFKKNNLIYIYFLKINYKAIGSGMLVWKNSLRQGVNLN